MATKKAAAKTAEKNAPTAEPDATVAEQPTEPDVVDVPTVEYVPSDDDGLSSIDDFDVDETTEVDANDEGWGYHGLTDNEVSSPEAIAAAELEVEEQAKAAAAAEGKTDD